MEQLNLFSKLNMSEMKSCAFSGHRNLDKSFSLRKMKTAIRKAIKKGVVNFYNGMAVGFDMLAAEYVLSLKSKFPNIRLIACIPCENQEKGFSAKEKEQYYAILSQADEKVYVSKTYVGGCMLKRNRYMADRADMLIVHCVKETGGTAYTVDYFEKKKKGAPIYYV